MRVLILAGGISHERDVSLKSGRRVADALAEAGLRGGLCALYSLNLRGNHAISGAGVAAFVEACRWRPRQAAQLGIAHQMEAGAFPGLAFPHRAFEAALTDVFLSLSGNATVP